MTLEVPPKVSPLAAALRGLLRDRWVATTTVLFAMTVVIYAFRVLSLEIQNRLTSIALPFLFLVLAVGALRHRIERLPQSDERHFWNDLALGFFCWLAVYTLYFFFPRETRPLPVQIAADVLYAFGYAAWILAIERQPHRRSRWRPTGLERLLSLPAVTVFVLGLLAYLVLIPVLVNTDEYETYVPSMFLFLTLDAYLTGKSAYLVWSSREPRWRAIYGALAAAAGLVLASDFTEAASYAGWIAWDYGGRLNFVWILPYVALVVAAGLRHRPFPKPRSEGTVDERIDDVIPGLSRRTMIFALAFPAVHFLFFALGQLDEASKSARELVVALWLVILGGIALIQHRMLEANVKTLLVERAHAQEALRRSEQNLRLMVAREEHRRALSASDERFAKVFRSRPDGISIVRFSDSRYVEVNDRFCALTGWRREEILGRTPTELDLWLHPEERDELIARLELDGSVRDFQFEFLTKHGQPRIGRLAVDTIDFGGEACVLASAQDVTEYVRSQKAIREQAALLDRASDAVGLVDLDRRVRYWNPSAESLSGWPAAEAIGRPATDLFLDDDGSFAAAWRGVLDRGFWAGTLRHATRDAQTVTVHSRWSLVRDASEQPQSVLVLSSVSDA